MNFSRLMNVVPQISLLQREIYQAKVYLSSLQDHHQRLYGALTQKHHCDFVFSIENGVCVICKIFKK